MVVRGPAEHAVLELTGELDFTYARDIVARVAELPRRVVSIDLSGLEFVDAEGAKALSDIVTLVESRWGDTPEIIGTSTAVERARSIIAACTSAAH